MSDKWLNDIRKRMQSFETDAPDNLWEDIAREMSKRGTSLKQRPRISSAILLWSKRAACVAVVIGVAVVAERLLIHSGLSNVEQMAESNVAKRSDVIPSQSSLATNTVSHVSEEPQATYGSPTNVSVFQKNGFLGERSSLSDVPRSSSSSLEPKSEEQEASILASGENEQEYSPSHNRKEATPSEKGEHGTVQRFEKNQRSGFLSNRSHKHIALSVYSSGGVGSSIHNASGNGGDYMVMAPGSSAAEDSLVFDIVTGNEQQNVQTKIHHRQPVRFGLMLSFPVTERLSLETGLTYTRLSADLKEGSASYYFDGEQKLHYIGVPLNVKYRVLARKAFSLYGSAGVLTEKRVYGSLDKNYVVDNVSNRQESERINSRPWQISVNAAVGVQYQFVKCAAVYAEPGVSYYFNDGSQVKTIYKQKPFNFNFNLGLRFILNK